MQEIVGFIIGIVILVFGVFYHTDNTRNISGASEKKHTPEDVYKLIENVYKTDDKYPRFELQSKGIYGLPSRKTIKQIAKFINKNSTEVLSIGAYNGAWELLIADSVNVPVYAVDMDPAEKQYYPVEKITVPSKEFSKFVKSKNINTLFVSWDPYESSMTLDAIKVLKPKYLIYVGEGYGGCTGSDKLHNFLAKSKKLQDVYYDTRDFMQDHCKIYELK